jgi:hypothetical protein
VTNNTFLRDDPSLLAIPGLPESTLFGLVLGIVGGLLLIAALVVVVLMIKERKKKIYKLHREQKH